MKDRKNWLDRIEKIQQTSSMVVVGFDAVIDRLACPIRVRQENGELLFEEMDEFGAFICRQNGLNCCIQLREIARKMGGNAALLSAALHQFGVPVHLMGSVKGIDKETVFAPLAGIPIYGVSPLGECLALEFTNGKVMLVNQGLVDFSWQDILREVGEKTLESLLRECQLLCLVNWSEMKYGNAIWNEIRERLANMPDSNKMVFLDLSDCTTKPQHEILKCLEMVLGFCQSRAVTISFNENEARHIAKIQGLQQEGSWKQLGQQLACSLAPCTVVIHTKKTAGVFSSSQPSHTVDGFFTPEPKVLTGCGDNFNAGYCLGLLNGLEDEGCLMLANLSAGYYVRHGYCATAPELVQYARKHFFVGENENADCDR